MVVVRVGLWLVIIVVVGRFWFIFLVWLGLFRIVIWLKLSFVVYLFRWLLLGVRFLVYSIMFSLCGSLVSSLGMFIFGIISRVKLVLVIVLGRLDVIVILGGSSMFGRYLWFLCILVSWVVKLGC